MSKTDQRQLPRMTQNFQVNLRIKGQDFSLEGRCVNIGQGGAFIKTEHWRSLQVNNRAILTFFLPPEFTGQNHVINLQGSAVVTRVDQENESVAVEFVRSLRHFERISIPDVAGKIRYERVSYYLSHLVALPLTEFSTKYPRGFFVERSRHFFDKTVMFQLITDVIDDQYVLEQSEQLAVPTDILRARVIEIKKRKSVTDADKVTISRSPSSDIVLYNRLVSRNHAYLQLGPPDKNCCLVDIGSTNGTFLNGKRISPHVEYELSDLDEISFGPETQVVYFSSGAFHSFLSKLKSSMQ